MELGPAVREAAECAMRVGAVPGFSIAATIGGRAVDGLCLGTDAVGNPLKLDTLVPVASVTKMATALAVLRLSDTGGLNIDDPVARHLRGASVAQLGVTLRHLLTHTSGLPMQYVEEAAAYGETLSWGAIAQVSLQTEPEFQAGSRVQYSNVGYALLAITVERVTGQTFSAALRALVINPLGIEAYLGEEPPRPPAVISDVNRPGTGTVLEQFNSAFWRSLASPSGGLHTTASGALSLVRAFCGYPPGFLRPATLLDAVSNQNGSLGGGSMDPFIWPLCPWGLGVELRGAKDPHWAPVDASAGSFGHLGYTGSVAWADPETNVAWAVLGTRTVDNLWVVESGPAIGAAILGMARTAVTS